MSQRNPNDRLRGSRHSPRVLYPLQQTAKPLSTDRTIGDAFTEANVPGRNQCLAGGQRHGRVPREGPNNAQGAMPFQGPFQDALQKRQLEGINALLSLANATASTQGLPAVPLAPRAYPRVTTSRRRLLAISKDRALRGAVALIFSAVISGALGFVFWAFAAHYQKASALGSVSAEVSAITFLASMGSLNLINVFARFLPEAGWHARRMVLVSYSGVVLTGLVISIIFLLTPLASGLILGGEAGRLSFVACVVLTSIFLVQDGGLLGFGRPGWVPVENVLVAVARLMLLPLAFMLMGTRIGVLWSWALPMTVAVLVVNALIIGRLAGRQAGQRPRLPPFGELGRFVAIESVTTAVAAATSAFLPALVTRRLGASQGGYFYVPWIITTMAALLVTSILISMVREAVANPESASLTIRRSLGLVLAAIIVGIIGCLFLSRLVLAPLGSEYVIYGAPLLRWTGFALPAMAINYLYWSTCLVRRRPWPVFALNLAMSVGDTGGIMRCSGMLC